MENIVEGGPGSWSTDSLTTAQALLLTITSRDFVVSLVITNNAPCYIEDVTTRLQTEVKIITEASSEVSCVKEALQVVCNNMDDHYTEWFQQQNNRVRL